MPTHQSRNKRILNHCCVRAVLKVWQCVHEQILPSIRRAGHEAHFTEIAMTHTGYEDPALRYQKSLRNLRVNCGLRYRGHTKGVLSLPASSASRMEHG